MTTQQTATPAPVSFTEQWGARGWIGDLGGRMHWVEFGTETDAVPVVFVHGLGGAHLNWALVGAGLAAGRKAFAIDLRGFGLTPRGTASTTVQANAALLDAFLRKIVGRPAVLVGNSMGGMVSILQTHANPDTVAGLVLVDPALPPARRSVDPRVLAEFGVFALPGVGERYMRRMLSKHTAAAYVDRVIRLCFSDPTRADPAMLRASAELFEARRQLPDKERAFMDAARSLMRVAARPARYQLTMSTITAPTLLVHGEDDRLVAIEAARAVARANPRWETAFLPGVGHTPQLETPREFVEIVDRWLSAHL